MHWFLYLASIISLTAFADTERVKIKVDILVPPVLPEVTELLPEGFRLQSKNLVGKWNFSIQKFETSCEEYATWRKKTSAGETNDNASSADYECSLSPDQPVTRVSWDTASAYCNDKEGRLPTESEWVVAAVISTGAKQACYDRAGSGTWVSSSNKLQNDRQAFLNCIFNNPDNETMEDMGLDIIEEQKNDVAMTWPGVNGVYGMEGNVWEWTATTWKPEGAIGDEVLYRVIKGGAFTNGRNIFINNPQWRNAVPQDTINYSNIGFRCVWDNGETLND